LVPYGEYGFVTNHPALNQINEEYDVEWVQIPATPGCNLFMGVD
jgi:hypothetical protein